MKNERKLIRKRKKEKEKKNIVNGNTKEEEAEWLKTVRKWKIRKGKWKK